MLKWFNRRATEEGHGGKPFDVINQSKLQGRYDRMGADKVHGVTYTPKLLADFVARKIVAAAVSMSDRRALRVFDPAVGEGELLTSLVDELKSSGQCVADASGFETDAIAADAAKARLGERFPEVRLNIS